MNIAERILSFSSFDDLFDYITGIEIISYNILNDEEYSVMLNLINISGAEFWNNIGKYRTQLADMKNWTELVLSNSGSMKLFGF